MAMIADYIERIEIDALWSGSRHIVWNLRRDVNILSGVNGMGKSTIMNKVVRYLLSRSSMDSARQGIRLTFAGGVETGEVRLDVIRSFDQPLLRGDLIDKMVDIQLNSELDFALYQLQRRYLDYQVNLSNRIVQLFTSGAPDAQEQAQQIAGEKTHFFDLIDELFAETAKKIDRTSNELAFIQLDEHLSPYKLSSGEKQMLIIMLTALVEDKKPHVIFMDEPEISLHIDWQKRLVGLVRDLNPNAQIILTTHSPAVIMDGWMDCVTDVADIIVK